MKKKKLLFGRAAPFTYAHFVVGNNNNFFIQVVVHSNFDNIILVKLPHTYQYNYTKKRGIRFVFFLSLGSFLL